MTRSTLCVFTLLMLSTGACAPMATGQEPVLAEGGTPTHIASDLSHVYVTTEKAGTTSLVRVDTQRWELETVCVLAGAIEQLELAAEHAYWLLASPSNAEARDEPVVAVQKVRKTREAQVEPVLRSSQRVTSFAIDATHMYWSQAGPADHPDEARTAGILRAMDPSSIPTNVVTRLRGEPHRVTLGGAHVYWATKEPGGGSAVMGWPKKGGDPTELLMLHPSEVKGKLPSLAAADVGVYVLTHRELILIGAGGKKSKRVKHGFVADAPELVFDYRHLYFRTNDGLMRMEPDGSEFLPFVQTGSGGFAVGADFVYWFEGDKVLRREK